jgi:hypothetical protein
MIKKYLLLIVTSFLISSCYQTESKNIESEETDFFLESLFFYNSIQELEDRFGASNIETEFVQACETCGPEGSPLEESYYSTVLFPNSKKEVYMDWNSDQTMVTNVSIESKDNVWSTKDGFKIGDSLSKVQNQVKKTFELIYFYEFTYNFNSFCSISFNNELDFIPAEAELFQSNDPRLKKLVLTRIEMRLPGTSRNN